MMTMKAKQPKKVMVAHPRVSVLPMLEQNGPACREATQERKSLARALPPVAEVELMP